MGFGRFFKRRGERNTHAVSQERVEAVRWVVDTYRRIASERGLAATAEVSETQIMAIYQGVERAYAGASATRNEALPAQTLKSIVLKFVLVYEMLGERAMEAHLASEVRQYLHDGLPTDNVGNVQKPDE